MNIPDKPDDRLAAKLEERLVLGRRAAGDRLMLADAILLAALDGSRHLTAGERAALQASPLTVRRFRTLAAQARRNTQAASDGWRGSHGMLRAASSGAPLAHLRTDDGLWTLHFLEHDGAWRLVLAVDGAAPFAARLVRDQPAVRVVDGDGTVILQGALDADGEFESAWPFEAAPASHFQEHGAGFTVEPAH